ncbi:MAG: hypothetical protein ACR2NL_08730, partial [Acidimicrobiia bacterium]
MEVDLEGLRHAVGLHEVTFVVYVKTMVSGVTLQIGYETRHVDERQLANLLERLSIVPDSSGFCAPHIVGTMPPENANLYLALMSTASDTPDRVLF